MTAGIVSYATYLPTWRLDGTDIGARGDRVVAGFDEDSTTMGVAAAAAALRADVRPAALYFAIRQHGRPSDPAQWCRAQG